MAYKFRVTLSHPNRGFFALDSSAFGYKLDNSVGLEVYARDEDTLDLATKYHIECGGFDSKQQALEIGEYLRTRLRIINCVLDLGLSIPTEDKTTGSISDAAKESAQKLGGGVFDPRQGLWVLPDDGLHFESVMIGRFHVFPSDPIFILDAAKKIWDTNFEFDSRAQNVIELLNLATKERTPKLKFLITYLALELLIDVKERSQVARDLLLSFISQIDASGLSDSKKTSLSGSLSNLTSGSFSGAFRSYANKIKKPENILGFTPTQLCSKCIELRNKIAHSATFEFDVDINQLAKALNQFAIGLLWTEYKFPQISIYRPADQITVDRFGFRLM